LRKITLLIFLTSALFASPYWVYFTNKTTTQTKVNIKLSEAASERRMRSSLHAAANFDDIPLHPRYIRMLEIAGAKIRTRSRWLNAVSVELEPSTLTQAQAGNINLFSRFNFVSSVKPVAVLMEKEHPTLLKKERLDTALYGNTFAQLSLLNIPKVQEMGYFGNGVKVGFLDSGLKRDHPVFNTLKLGAEHDFVTGDEIYIYEQATAQQLPLISNYEIIKQPEKHGDNLFFVADVILGASSSKRTLFWSKKQANSWTSPASISATTAITRSYAVSGNAKLLLVWEQGNDEESRELRWGEIINGNFAQGTSPTVLKTNARNPLLLSDTSSEFLFYVKGDSVIELLKGKWNSDNMNWENSSKIAINAKGVIFDRPQVFISNDTILVSALDLIKGKLYFARSIDAGSSFTTLSSPVVNEVSSYGFCYRYLVTAEINSDGSTSLHFFSTSNWGNSWTTYLSKEKYLVISNINLKFHKGLMQIAFESAGQIYSINQTKTGDIASWSPAAKISSPDFCYEPYITTDTNNLEIIWTYRGDKNTDFDKNEDGVQPPPTSRSQPSHGSRVTALVAGYQGLTYIGAAPGVEVYIGKTEKHINRYGSEYEFRVEEDLWVEGLEWMERMGVDIVNSSLAYGDWYSYSDRNGVTSPASRAASMAAERGVLVVNAAGNVRDYEHYIIPPADARGILSVGGVDTLGNWWAQGAASSGSAVGPTYDGRMKPELVAPATGVLVIDVDSDFRKYFYGNGTSYAAPLITGAAALMLEVHPEYKGNPDTIITLLQKSASNASAPNDTLGYGIPDVYRAILPLPQDADTFSINELLPPFPNPFNPTNHKRIYFPFRLSKASFVDIRIYTLSGELLIKKSLTPLVPNITNDIAVGSYNSLTDLQTMGAFWNATTADGKPVGAGLYLLVMKTRYGSYATRFALVR